MLPEADLELLSTIDSLQFTDPEDSLYAGFASLSIIGKLVTTPGALTELALCGADLSQLAVYTQNAILDLETGLAEVPGEARSLHGALHVFEAKFMPRWKRNSTCWPEPSSERPCSTL
jgi:hypothetical protein